MAKKEKEIKQVDTKAINKMLGDYLPKAPDLMPDGTLKTQRWLTGITMLDLLLNGGFPQGHTIAIGAEPGVGKTTMLIQALGNIVEKYDKKVYYLDAEGGATYELIQDMGYADLLWNPQTNPEGKFYLLSITTIQELATILKQIASDPETAAVVLDSDTSIIDGTSLLEDDLGTSNRAAASDARMWSQHGKKLQAVIKGSNMCFILVHQARVDLAGFRPKVTASGGNAAKHMASAEIWGRKKGWLTKDFSEVKSPKEADGSLLVLSTSKNRLTKPFSAVELPIIFGRGISNKHAYRKWLETHSITDDVTGEIKPMLNRRGAYYDLTFGGQTYTVMGGDKVWALIDEHYEEIAKFVENSGGFELEKADEE